MFSLKTSAFPVFVNDKAFKGLTNLARIAKSVLFELLQEMQNSFDGEMVKYYHFVVKLLCTNIKTLESRPKTINS